MPKPAMDIGKHTLPSIDGCNTNDPTMAVRDKATIQSCSGRVMDSIRDVMIQRYDYVRNCQDRATHIGPFAWICTDMEQPEFVLDCRRFHTIMML